MCLDTTASAHPHAQELRPTLHPVQKPTLGRHLCPEETAVFVITECWTARQPAPLASSSTLTATPVFATVWEKQPAPQMSVVHLAAPQPRLHQLHHAPLWEDLHRAVLASSPSSSPTPPT